MLLTILLNYAMIISTKEQEVNEMKKALIITLSIITLPFEAAAYLIARIVKMQGWEDVQSPAEWLMIYKENEDEEN